MLLSSLYVSRDEKSNCPWKNNGREERIQNKENANERNGSTDAHKEYTEYVAFVGRTMNITYKLSARGYKTRRQIRLHQISTRLGQRFCIGIWSRATQNPMKKKERKRGLHIHSMYRLTLTYTVSLCNFNQDKTA